MGKKQKTPTCSRRFVVTRLLNELFLLIQVLLNSYSRLYIERSVFADERGAESISDARFSRNLQLGHSQFLFGQVPFYDFPD